MHWLPKHTLQRFLSCAALLCALALLPGVTRADSVTLNPGSSATFNYVSTFGAAGQATATYALSSDGKTLTISFLNTSTSDTYLSAFGFNTSPNLPTTAAIFSGLPAGSNWNFTTNGSGGVGNFEAGASGNGNQNRLKPGEGGTLTLTLNAPLTNGITLDVTMIHLTSLPDESSQKPIGVVVRNGGGNPPPAEVPEPATMLLLGSGLAALARIRQRARREH